MGENKGQLDEDGRTKGREERTAEGRRRTMGGKKRRPIEK